MFRIVSVLFLASAAFALTPIEESAYYKVYRLSDVDLEELKAVRSYANYNGPRSIVEYPANQTVPEDDGGNFGDIEFSSTLKNGMLIERDTIINEDTSQNILIEYERTFNGSYLEDFKLLNFGRQRGWSFTATIHHSLGLVYGSILVKAGNKVRILAETYAKVEPVNRLT